MITDKKYLNDLFNDLINHKKEICVIGLGYVGLPLAVLLAKKFKVIGCDINLNRILELSNGYDSTNEITKEQFDNVGQNLSFRHRKIHSEISDLDSIKSSSIFILALPTPVNHLNDPDYNILINGICDVLYHLSQKNGSPVILILESTVKPNDTMKLIKNMIRNSCFKINDNLGIGYSPERVNPGDKKHTIDKVTKVVAGSHPNIKNFIADIYGQVIPFIHRAPSIEVAEGAKLIENVQRDVNIALINELALIFNKADIDFRAVLNAARTKWNWLDFTPGLVGGHCIGVDPYYLMEFARDNEVDCNIPRLARNMNENMVKFVADKCISLILQNPWRMDDIKVLICGATFKEDVPDFRNSKSEAIITHLSKFGIYCCFYDPFFSTDGFVFDDRYNAVIIAVRHKEFLQKEFQEWIHNQKIVLDLKDVVNKDEMGKGILWKL